MKIATRDLPKEPDDHRFNKAPSERNFLDIRSRYVAFGGILDITEAASLLDPNRLVYAKRQLSLLISKRAITYFEWRGGNWLPMFQFHPEGILLDSNVREVTHAFGLHVDGWEIASWFVAPNKMLGGRWPINVLKSNLDLVIQAARAERLSDLAE